MTTYPGSRNPFWKGGRSIASNGYVLIRVGKDHPLADVRGYAYEHRIVAAEKLGRSLRPKEQIHHIDGNRRNNAPENIEVFPSMSAHRLAHRRKDSNRRRPDEPNPVILCACGCGGKFKKFDNSNRPRRFKPGHNSALGKTP